MPARSSSGSRSPRNVTNASASFSVERDGAPPGIRSRGMPIVQRTRPRRDAGADVGVRAVGEQHVEIGAGRGRGVVAGGARHAAFAQRVGKPRRERPRQSRQLLAVVGVRRFEPEREIVGVSARAGGDPGSGNPARKRSIKATSGATRSGRPRVVAGSNSGCGPVPKKSERTKIGGARSNARGQGRGSKRARLPTTKPRPDRRIDVDPSRGAASASRPRSAARFRLEAGAAVRDEQVRRRVGSRTLDRRRATRRRALPATQTFSGSVAVALHQQRRHRPAMAEAAALRQLRRRREGRVGCRRVAGLRRHGRLVRVQRIRALALDPRILARRARRAILGAVRARRTRGVLGAGRARRAFGTAARGGRSAPAARARAGRALGAHRRRVEAVGRQDLDALLQQPLDLGEVLLFLGRDERDRLARGAGAAGAADAVDVVLGHVRQLVIDDERQVVDVEAARGDVGGDQHLQLAFLERGERLHARLLRLVAVDRVGDEAVLLELPREARRAVLGAHEAEHLLQVARADEVLEQRALGLLRAPCRRSA